MDNTTLAVVVEASVEDPPPLNNQHMVMLLGFICMMLATPDLKTSLDNMKNKQLAKKLQMMFVGTVCLYSFEFCTLLGTVIEVLCPVDLWLLAFSHYGIKVIVSYSYVFRVKLVLDITGKAQFGKWPERILKALSVSILITAFSNLIKVFLTYESFVGENGECVFVLPEYWSYLDEIMFGCIDMLTLGFLANFYWEQKRKEYSYLKGEAKESIYRVLLLSGITFSTTILATIINNQIPSIGLTSSIIDITVDILSMMRIYTKCAVAKEKVSPKSSIEFTSSLASGKPTTITSVAPANSAALPSRWLHYVQ